MIKEKQCNFMKRFVYVDNAATTSVAPEVLEAMLPFFKNNYGNASSLYSKGRDAKVALEDARERIAAILKCKPSEIFFTSCGCESDNWAIKGTALAHAKKGKHIITSKIEHPAVLSSCAALEKQGYEVTYVDVNEDGFVDPKDIEAAIRPDTILVAVMHANNEIGTIQPIREIADIAHRHGVLCFTDAVQSVGNIPVSIPELGVDMLSFSGHKNHAPKGVGVLYIKSGTRVFDLIDGGGQERGRRAGTENVAYIVGVARALELAVEKLPDMKRIEGMRDRLIDTLLEKVPYSRLNGSKANRLPGNLNISFEYIEGESMLLLCDMEGICISTGSACSSNSLEPSHVLLAIGLPHEKAHGSARITLSHENTEEDVDYIIEKLPPIVERLRNMSPIYPANR